MKQIFTLCFSLLCFAAISQIPQGINYQAVARNSSNGVLAIQGVRVKISIIDSIPSGVIQYSETHTVTTNQFGLFNIVIGTGNVVSGTFTSITWPTGNKFIK